MQLPADGFSLVNIIGATVIGCVYIVLSCLVKEPARKKLSAIILAGAGSVYWNAGFGVWEYLFAAVMLVVAFKGLGRYYFIGIGWLLHTCWDVLHHLYGTPIIPLAPTSSAGCAVCDAVMAAWFFTGAPNIFALRKKQTNFI